MHSAITTKLDSLNNKKNLLFLFLSSDDQVAKMLLFNNGCHVNT